MKTYFTKYLPVEGEIKEGDEIVFTRHGKTFKKKVKYCKYDGGYEGKLSGEKPAIYVIEGTKGELWPHITFPEKYFGGTHHHWDRIESELKPEEIGLSKLFLCSRDIQVGDEIWSEIHEGLKKYRYTNAMDLSENPIPTYSGEPDHTAYKVIGEVSPEAVWVKEGDEFDKEDLELWYYQENFEANFNDDPWWCDYDFVPPIDEETMKRMEIKIVAKLKCSQCNTYH